MNMRGKRISEKKKAGDSVTLPIFSIEKPEIKLSFFIQIFVESIFEWTEMVSNYFKKGSTWSKIVPNGPK